MLKTKLLIFGINNISGPRRCISYLTVQHLGLLVPEITNQNIELVPKRLGAFCYNIVLVDLKLRFNVLIIGLPNFVICCCSLHLITFKMSDSPDL